MTYNKEILRCFQCSDLIRLGRMKDGGYVIPKRLTRKSVAMISCGISTDWSFEKDFISLSKISNYFLVDKSTSIRSLFKRLLECFKNKNVSINFKIFLLIHFIYKSPRVFLMRRRQKNKFIESFIVPSKKTYHKDKSTITLEKLLSSLKTNKKKNNIFLKLDIEGSEWDIYPEILKNLDSFSGIAIEVHSLKSEGKNLEDMIQKFLSSGMVLVHVHPNNNGGYCNEESNLPDLLELTFINSSLLTKKELNQEKLKEFTYNIKLDRPCNPKKKEMIIN